jgi:hypothetical protein
MIKESFATIIETIIEMPTISRRDLRNVAETFHRDYGGSFGEMVNYPLDFRIDLRHFLMI